MLFSLEQCLCSPEIEPVIAQSSPACPPLCYGPTEFLQLRHRSLRFTYKAVHSPSAPSSFHHSGADGAFWLLLFTEKKSKDERLWFLPTHTGLLTPVGCPL